MSDRRDVRDAAEKGDERPNWLLKLSVTASNILGLTRQAWEGSCLVYTAGVGEMAPHIRGATGLDIMGIKRC